MSKREAVLCDIEEGPETWSSGKIRTPVTMCAQLSIGTCPICRKDVCALHALHPDGGLILRMESVTHEPVAGSPPRDVPWGIPGSGVSAPTPDVRIMICKPCRRLVDSVLQTTCADAAEYIMKMLAAAVTAKALAPKEQHTP